MDRALYPDDLVVLKVDEARLASVERTSDSLDFHVPFPHNGDDFIDLSAGAGVGATTLQRFKATGAPPKGTVLVRWENEALQLIRSDSVSLVVRSLLIGDIVKKDVSQAQSGVVINTFTKCLLRPLCEVSHSGRPGLSLKGLPPPHSGDGESDSPWTVLAAAEPPRIRNVPASELMYSDPIADLTSGDLIVYKDWIGRIRDKSDSVCVKLTDGCVVEIPGEDGEHLDGVVDAFAIGDVLQTKKGVLRNGTWIYGSYSPNTLSVGTVVRVRPSAVEIDWLQNRIGSTEAEPPGMFQDAEWESADFVIYDRSRRPAETSMDMLGTLSNSELDLRLYQRVRFRDIDTACAKYLAPDGASMISRHDRRDNMGFDLNVFDVVAFRTEVSVQWQDLSISVHDSAALVPDSGIDDNHAAWPGEITHSLKIVANDASQHCERPEKVGVVQAVNAAARMATVSWNSESYIEYNERHEGQQSGADAILRHHIATGRGVIEEISLYDIDTPAQVNVRRGDIVLINGDREHDPIANGARDRTWLGEIVDTPLDGSLVIRLGVAEPVRDVRFLRKDVIVAVRSDDTDAIEDELWENDAIDSEMEEALGQAYEDTDHPMWDVLNVDDQAYFEDENGMELDSGAWEDEAWEDSEEELEDGDTDNADDSDTITTSERPARLEPRAKGASGPEAYLVLESAVPITHRFAVEEATVNASRMKRIQKDHRILASSEALPVGVFVRTWETRLDLLRFLIIGPTETPYANAPFIIDMYLPPAYPTEPPKVYFHSWLPDPTSGSHGRLNPNLYEDGTICLSLLGTWAGAPGEGWSPTKSTVLQVVVSILGLVLVREPYYNEAGYEALVGTQAAKVPSSVYSERVFLRSRGLIITTLKALLGGEYREAPGHETFEDVLRWIYHAVDGPKLLQTVTEDVGAILERSDGSQDSNGLTIMSQGACIPLRRVLARLQGFKRADMAMEECASLR